MKKILTLLVAAATSLILLPQQAEARHYGTEYTYVSGYTSCGCPIHTRRVVTGYDYYGNPVYSYYSVPVNHQCRPRYSSGVSIHIGGGGHYHNCAPAPRYVRSYPSYHRSHYSSHYRGHHQSRYHGRHCR